MESWFRSLLLLPRARALVPSVGGFLRTQRQKRKKKESKSQRICAVEPLSPPRDGRFVFVLCFSFFFWVVGWDACALLVVVVVVDGRCCCCWSEESFMLFLVSLYLSVLPYLTLCVLCLLSITHFAATATAAPLPLFCPSLLSSLSLSL